jgi:trk system potassium uptake protein TrkH
MALLVLSLSMICALTFVLLVTEVGGGIGVKARAQFLELLFENVSAFGTVGLSTGITPRLSVSGKIVIIVTMFIGRLGPLTLAYALQRRAAASHIRYPAEQIMIG